MEVLHLKPFPPILALIYTGLRRVPTDPKHCANVLLTLTRILSPWGPMQLNRPLLDRWPLSLALAQRHLPTRIRRERRARNRCSLQRVVHPSLLATRRSVRTNLASPNTSSGLKLKLLCISLGRQLPMGRPPPLLPPYLRRLVQITLYLSLRRKLATCLSVPQVSLKVEAPAQSNTQGALVPLVTTPTAPESASELIGNTLYFLGADNAPPGLTPSRQTPPITSSLPRVRTARLVVASLSQGTK